MEDGPAALSPDHLASLGADAAWAAAEAGDPYAAHPGRRLRPRLKSAAATMSAAGSTRAGAGTPTRCGTVRGLAQTLVARGVPIHGATPVLALQEDRRWRATASTPGGTVRAKQAIIATNAYTDLHHAAAGDLVRRVIPATSSVLSPPAPSGPTSRPVWCRAGRWWPTAATSCSISA